MEAVKAKETKIHILVNNSGMSWGAPYEEYVFKHPVCVLIRSLIRFSNSFPEKEGWDNVLSLNVKSIFYGSGHCLSSPTFMIDSGDQ